MSSPVPAPDDPTPIDPVGEPSIDPIEEPAIDPPAPDSRERDSADEGPWRSGEPA